MSSALQTLHDRMEQLTLIADGFVDACVLGTLEQQSEILWQSRGVRAEVARAKADTECEATPETAEDLLLLCRVRELVERLRASDEAIRLWLERPLPPDAELLLTPSGVACYADVLVPATWDVSTDLVVLVGAGLEPVATELLRRGQRRVVAYVPDDATHAYPDQVVVAADEQQIEAAVLQMTPNAPDRVISKRHPDCAVDTDEHSSMMRRAETALIEARVHFNTINNFADTWVSQGLANLPAVATWPTIDALRDAFRGMPMVIVAPGPSLAKNIHLLPRLKGKALIVTFSHTMKPLHDAGVVPDLVLCVDPQDVRYHFDGVSLDGVGAVVNGVTVHPELFDLGAPRYLTFAANSALDDWVYEAFGDDARLLAGGSVATSACALGLQWGCDPIAFVGLDLSFPDSKYYIDTSCDGGTEIAADDTGHMIVRGWSDGFRNLHMVRGAAESRAEKVIELPGYHGGNVSTNFMFSLFHRWFEERARDQAGLTRMINCTEGGARIDGTDQLTLAEFVETLGDECVDVAAALDAAVARTDAGGRRGALAGRVSAMLRSVERVRSLAGRCRQLARRAATSERAHVDLEQTERELGEAMAPVMFLSLLRQREIGDAMSIAHSATSTTETLAASERLFEVIVDSANWLQPLLRHTATFL